MIWNKFEKFSVRERGLLALATVAILAALGNFLVVQPTLERLRELEDEIDDKVVLRERNRVMLADELLVREEHRSASALLKRSASSSEEIENLKERVGRLAGQAGVALDSINHREPAKSKQYEEYVIEVSRFEARIPDLLRFLHEISSTEGLLRVGRLTMRPKQKSDLVEGALTINKVALIEAPEVAAAQ